MLPDKWHRNIFLFGIIALASGMMFGTVSTSIPQGILGANWLLEKDFGSKWLRLKTNKFFWILISLFFLHVIGLAYTENMERGLEDVKNKLPLIVLPLIFFSTKPLDTKEFKLLLGFFLLSVIVSSVCCFLIYSGYTKKVVVDVRQASVFMSHIRFSLFIALAIFALAYVLLTDSSRIIKTICAASIIWLLFFMNKLEMATGIICLATIGPLLIITYSIKKLNKIVSLAIISLLVLGSVVLVKLAYSSLNMFEPDPNSPGNILIKKYNTIPYLFDTNYDVAENGNRIAINICESELEREWPKRSNVNYRGNDKKGNALRYTLFRYLSSKGLTKDSVGLSSIGQDEITFIENGITNYKYTSNSGIKAKWRELIWEYTKYKRGENPSGHSLSMRLEFWKTGLHIISKNLFFGVGTGDVQTEYNKAYIELNSKLDFAWRLRCHNQYLAITVAFGIAGLLLFLTYLFYPAIVLRKKLHLLYWPFFWIALLSFFTEDTLETQSGVTFFMFFNTLFLWLSSFKSANSISENKTI